MKVLKQGGHRLFGVEEFLVNTLLKPDSVRRAIDTLKEVAVEFGLAQIEFNERIPCPLILHICGEEEVVRDVEEKLTRHIDSLGPGCAVPLDAPYGNMKVLAEEAKKAG